MKANELMIGDWVEVPFLEGFLDFVHSHYIDYRNLIEQDITIEVPANMYNLKLI